MSQNALYALAAFGIAALTALNLVLLTADTSAPWWILSQAALTFLTLAQIGRAMKR